MRVGRQIYGCENRQHCVKKNIDASLSKAYEINFKFRRPTFILNISIDAPA